MAFGRSDTKKVALFVDGSNHYAASMAVGWMSDFDKVLGYYKSKYDLFRAYYYTAVETEGNIRIRPLIDHLEYNGWEVVQKPTKTFIDERTGLPKIKGNMDIDIAVDVLLLSTNPDIRLDEVIVFTGDGDFKRLFSAIKERGVRVTVVSTIAVQPPMIADELRRSADNFLELATMRDKWARDEDVRENSLPRNQGQSLGRRT